MPTQTNLLVRAVPGGRPGARLRQLGLRPGTSITLLGRTSGGGRLVAVGTGRLVLDRRTMDSLTLAPGPDPA